ncbi:hypothetical protein MMPV_003869 [Pyropia vietnamensis]
MKRSFGESADLLPWMGSADAGVDHLFCLTQPNFLSSSPKLAPSQLPALPSAPARLFAHPPEEDAAPSAPVRLIAAGQRGEQESGSSACSTSTEGALQGQHGRASLKAAGVHGNGVAQALQPTARLTGETTYKMVGATRGASGMTRGQVMSEIPDGEEKDEPYHCSCGVGEVGVETLIEFIRAHPKMIAVASDDGSPLLIRTVARQLVAQMRRRRHSSMCTAFPKVPAGLESVADAGSDGNDHDAAATAAAAAAAAAAAPLAMCESERKALRVVLNRSAAERSRLRKKARFETLSATLAEKDATIAQLRDRVRSLNGAVSHLQLLLKIKGGGYGVVLPDHGGGPQGHPGGGVDLSALMEEATQAWDRPAHAA